MIIPVAFFIGIMMGAFGGIFMKVGASRIGVLEMNSISDGARFLQKAISSPYLVSGIFLYFLSAVIWSYLLTKLDISLVQPILALTYVVTPILAILLLQEKVSFLRWIGILVIIAGVAIVAKSAS